MVWMVRNGTFFGMQRIYAPTLNEIGMLSSMANDTPNKRRKGVISYATRSILNEGHGSKLIYLSQARLAHNKKRKVSRLFDNGHCLPFLRQQPYSLLLIFHCTFTWKVNPVSTRYWWFPNSTVLCRGMGTSLPDLNTMLSCQVVMDCYHPLHQKLKFNEKLSFCETFVGLDKSHNLPFPMFDTKRRREWWVSFLKKFCYKGVACLSLLI